MSDEGDRDPEEEEEEKEGDAEQGEDGAEEGHDEPEPEPEPDPKTFSGTFQFHIGNGVYARVVVPEEGVPVWVERALANDLYWMEKELVATATPEPADGGDAPPPQAPKLEPNMPFVLELKTDSDSANEYELKPRPSEDPPPAEEPASVEAGEDEEEGGAVEEVAPVEEEPEKEDTDIFVDLFTLVCWQSVECATLLLKRGASLDEFVEWCANTVSIKDKMISDNFCLAAEAVREADLVEPPPPQAEGEEGDEKPPPKGKRRARTFVVDFQWMFIKPRRFADQLEAPMTTHIGGPSDGVGDGRTGFYDDLCHQWQMAGCVPKSWIDPAFITRPPEMLMLYRMLLRLTPGQLKALATPPATDEAEDEDAQKAKAPPCMSAPLYKVVKELHTRRRGRPPVEIRVDGAAVPDANGVYRRRAGFGRTVWWKKGGGLPRWKEIVAGVGGLAGATVGGCVVSSAADTEALLDGGVRVTLLCTEHEEQDFQMPLPAEWDLLAPVVVTGSVRGGQTAIAHLNPDDCPPPGAGQEVSFFTAAPGMTVGMTPSAFGEHSFKLGKDVFKATVVRREHDGIVLRYADAEQGGPPAEVEEGVPFPRERLESKQWWDTVEPHTAAIVNVLEVQKSVEDGRLRGRILNPHGWITLVNYNTKERFGVPRTFHQPFAADFAKLVDLNAELVSDVRVHSKSVDGLRAVSLSVSLAASVEFEPRERYWFMGPSRDIARSDPMPTLAWYETAGGAESCPPLSVTAWAAAGNRGRGEAVPTSIEAGGARALIPRMRDLEKGADSVLGQAFGHTVLPGYPPRVWQSDLILLIFALEDEKGYGTAFTTLLSAKLKLPRKATDTPGFFQMLYDSMFCFSPRLADVIFRATPAALCPLGPVPFRPFCKLVLPAGRLHPKTIETLVEVFSTQLLEHDDWLEAGPPEMVALRRAAKENVFACEQAQRALSEEGQRAVSLIDGLVQSAKKVPIFTAEFLYKAVVCENYAVVAYLLDHGTPPAVRASRRESLQDLVSFVVQRRQTEMLCMLLRRGGAAGNIKMAWRPGEGGALRHLQTNWPAEDAAKVLGLWRDLERQRGSDPAMQYGLLRELRTAAP